ncbi:hypothetical protein [Novosphingopyxis sp.]|uniref:hypothetical protein n=1 Tax=Novosphingopyxis sp. TaxID=2709690 RepID=UPI003B5AB97C
MTDIFDQACAHLSQTLTPLPDDLTAAIVDDVRMHEAIARARTKLDRGTLLYSEDEMRMAQVHENAGWQVDVMVFFKHRLAPISVISPTAMYIVSAGEALNYRGYALSRPIDADYFDQPVHLQQVEAHPLTRGDWVFMQPGLTTGIVADPGPESVLLRFLGPPVTPVMASFDADSGKLESLTMGGLVPTSQSFFTDLARCLIAGSQHDAPWHAYEELDIVRDLLRGGLTDDSIHIATRWKMAQALANSDRDDVRTFMERVAASDSLSLKAKAKRVLAAIEA